MTKSVRVRFAPSPTGPLHIGGVRTALYNYLFAKKHGGTFILRIEDTDQARYVKGAEEYILESLHWLGLDPQEGPGIGGAYGPYRQSERKAMYKEYAETLVNKGKAYYAFDSSDSLEEKRAADPNFKYGYETRMELTNSLTLDPLEAEKLKTGENTVIRLKFEPGQHITVTDEIRGEVSFDSADLDDKVILKGDGMPTYHLANIVDDHLMEITHVIRGEEWLPSTAHHVFMYDAMGWEAPSFSHLPLIFKPSGQGKLSKRDGAKFGFPVFPLDWNGGEGDTWPGFREGGYLPDALINFLAMLGWSPRTETELFNMKELIQSFSLDGIVKSGARFDIDKALWFNQQYLMAMSNDSIAALISDQAASKGYNHNLQYLATACGMMKERVHLHSEILNTAYYLFEVPHTYDMETFEKKYLPSNAPHFLEIAMLLESEGNVEGNVESMSSAVKGYIADHSLKMGEILPILRICLTGTMQGPDLFETAALFGGKESADRIRTLINKHA